MLFCTLCEWKRDSIIKNLDLVDEVVNCPYLYEPQKPSTSDVNFHLSLLGCTLYNQLDWEIVAYIQLIEQLDHDDANTLLMTVPTHKNETFESTFSQKFPAIYEKYKFILSMGSAYSEYLQGKNSLLKILPELYDTDHREVIKYIAFMADLFVRNINYIVDDLIEANKKAANNEEEMNVNGLIEANAKAANNEEEWCKKYFEVFKAMVTGTEHIIIAAASFEDEEKNVRLADLAETILSRLNACWLLKEKNKRSADPSMTIASDPNPWTLKEKFPFINQFNSLVDSLRKNAVKGKKKDGIINLNSLFTPSPLPKTKIPAPIIKFTKPRPSR